MNFSLKTSSFILHSCINSLILVYDDIFPSLALVHRLCSICFQGAFVAPTTSSPLPHPHKSSASVQLLLPVHRLLSAPVSISFDVISSFLNPCTSPLIPCILAQECQTTPLNWSPRRMPRSYHQLTAHALYARPLRSMVLSSLLSSLPAIL